MRKKSQPAYFKVFALKDRTALLAMPTRKPHPKQLDREGISEEGVWRWFTEDDASMEVWKLEVRHLGFATLANHLNLKRTLREQIEPKLEALSVQLAAIKEQLDRLSDPATTPFQLASPFGG